MYKIGFHQFGLNKPTINSWFGGMYRSLFKALEELGCHVSYTDDEPEEAIDVLVLPMGGGQDKSSIKAMLKYDGPVILNIGAAAYWFREGLLNRWRDRILFLYGTDRSEYSFKMAESVGLPYHYMPFGSNPEIMRPLELPKLYDVVFVGNADSGIGRHQYTKLLLEELHDRKILFVGSGWEKYGYPFQTIAWGELLNIIYNISSICLNISNDEQKSAASAPRMDANNRLFDLAMAGCFQISNAPQLVRHYFDDSEVVAIDSPEEWVSAIRYYLDNPEEAHSFRMAARGRALADHDWKNRAKNFIAEIELQLSRRKKIPAKIPSWKKALRLRDGFI